jgi:hypothetical protein
LGDLPDHQRHHDDEHHWHAHHDAGWLHHWLSVIVEPYFCSGSNVASGMQAAINQLCQPASSCGESVSTTSTMEMIIITDGDPNCSTYTSQIAGQNCPAGPGTTGNNQLLSDAQTLATTAGQDGISVSTIY